MQAKRDSENRIDRRLAAAKSTAGGALLPYLTGGYPSLDATCEWIKRFDARGITGIEIGFPYSDSIADGPVIQDSFHRALANGLRVQELFEQVASVRRQVDVALIAMVSFSIVQRMGVEAFVRRAGQCGFDGLIVPDVPYEEADEIATITAALGLRHIMLVAPSTPLSRAAEIARRSTGFVYQVSTRGITGERDKLPDDLRTRVEHLRTAGNKPVCVGFGISRAEHVRQVCRVADGAIVGSAIVRRITEALDANQPHDKIVYAIANFVDELAESVGRVRGPDLQTS